MTNKFEIIKPLIIGIGVAGKRHLDAQLALGIKTGVYTANSNTAKSLKQQKNIIVFDNLNDAIDWSNLVHVCTPDDKHTEFVAMAIKKGKAVLCEKSFTTNLSDALYLQRLAHKYKSILIVGQNYRFTPTFLETRKRVLAGDLGTIIKIETTYLHDKAQYQQRSPANKNRDFLYIGGSHAVDLMCWIANEKVISVKAKSKKTKQNYPTNYNVQLKFASGLIGNITLDASSKRLMNGTSLIVEGKLGKLTSHNKSDKLLFHRNGKKKQIIKLPNIQTHTIALEAKIIDDYLLGQKKSYWPLPDVNEALNTIEILDTIQKISI